jgi:hypothetical protein
MLRRSLSALAASILVLALSGCAGGGKGDSVAEVKAHVAEQMVDQGLTPDQADCFADAVVEKMGAADVKDVDFSADEAPADQQEDIAAAAIDALSSCDIDAGSLDG